MKALKLTIFLIIFLIGAFFIVDAPGLGAILGISCIGIATPKKDGRFKTGFKDNQEVNGSLMGLGLSWIALSIGLYFFLWIKIDLLPNHHPVLNQFKLRIGNKL